MADQRALLLIDVQRGFEDPELGARDNPRAEENIAALIAAWRERGDPIVVIQHDWEGGPLERGTPGFELKDVVDVEPDLRIVKTVHSSFHGDVDLDAWLQGARHRRDRRLRDPDELLLRDDRADRVRPRLRRLVRARRDAHVRRHDGRTARSCPPPRSPA